MRPQGLATPNVNLTNNIFAANGIDLARDVVHVSAGRLTAVHLTSADNIGIPFHFTPNGAGSLFWSIVWDAANVLVDAPVSVIATCSMFRAWTGSPTGPNIDAGLDPFFVTTARGDYRLDAAVSINAVDRCLVGALQDADSAMRPDGPLNLWDRGAFEAP